MHQQKETQKNLEIAECKWENIGAEVRLPNHCSLFLQLLKNRPPTRHTVEYSCTNAQVPVLRGKEIRMSPSATVHSSPVSSSLTSLMSEVSGVEWEALKMGTRKPTAKRRQVGRKKSAF